MRIRVLILALLLAFLIVPSAAAQDKKPGCDPAALIADLAKLKSTGDQAKDMQALLDVQSQISAQNVACNGLTFTGKGAKVYDPFVLPAGTYRLKLTEWKGVVWGASFEGLEDTSCAYGAITDSRREDVGKSDGCKVVLSIDPYSSPDDTWTFTLEPLK